ncbi:OLC1v1018089C1 [Oldenlandia corymbosa var. corymbosa]|uniref:Thioredoxin n=1 Tax=Oldenlandia corymbosa var. corymbosa TaxID=529605 RepID=A0AAV1EAU3_OLDCO|nr:OLC1v1018089C1 [Oldenlandia corymbosa var. corymbosa]
MAGKVISLKTTQEWEEQLQMGKEPQKLVVIDFSATWCGPCRLMSPVLDELAGQHPQVTFLKVDVDDLRSVAQQWGVEAMPTFVVMKEGKVVERFSGADKDKLIQLVTKHLNQ